MTPKQVSIQLTDEQLRQIEYLQEKGFGTRTDIVRLAIDRMYQVQQMRESDLPRRYAHCRE